MAIIFKSILGMTIVGSVLFILILAITPITKKIFSSRWHLYSRIAALLFFLLPIGAVAADAFEKLTHMLLRSGSPALSDFWQEIPSPLAIPAFGTETQATASQGGILESMLAVLPYIWVVGAALFAGLKLLQLMRFKRLVSKSSERISDKVILDLFEKVKQDMQIHGRIELITDSVIPTPMLIGLLRAQLILPKTDLSEKELELVFRHELTHYRHGDLWIKLASTAVCAVHWFNPLAYLLANSLERLLEVSCDAEVVKNMDYDERRIYGSAILSVLSSAIGKQASLYAAFSSNKETMKVRLSTMLNEKKQSKKATVISILVLLFICIAGISVSAAAYKDNRITEPLAYTPIDESQLDYAEIEQYEVTVATDETGTPEYTFNAAPETNASAATDADEIPNPLDFAEGTQPVLTSFLWPTENIGYLSAGFQEYVGHTGMDMVVPKDTPVYASNAGVVVKAMNSNVGYGKHIVIDHGSGYQTVYAHCNSLDVAVGDMVEAGQTIAAVGRSGNATGFLLHFEVRRNGIPMDPKDYVNAENSPMDLPQ